MSRNRSRTVTAVELYGTIAEPMVLEVVTHISAAANLVNLTGRVVHVTAAKWEWNAAGQFSGKLVLHPVNDVEIKNDEA